MTVVLKKSIFIHISKTGGTWVTKSLEQIGKKKGFNKHCTLQELIDFHPNLKGKSVFAFVRNPVTWYQSRWSCNWNRYFFLNPEKRPKLLSGPLMLYQHTRILNTEELNDFQVWSSRVISDYPKFISEHYQHYLGINYNNFDYVGKFENLQSDLVKALESLGEESNIGMQPPANEASKDLIRLWDKGTLGKVIGYNRDLMNKFNYSVNLNDYTDLWQ